MDRGQEDVEVLSGSTASAVGCPLAVSEQGEDTCRMCCPVRSTPLQSYLAETALMPVHLRYVCPETALMPVHLRYVCPGTALMPVHLRYVSPETAASCSEARDGQGWPSALRG